MGRAFDWVHKTGNGNINCYNNREDLSMILLCPGGFFPPGLSAKSPLTLALDPSLSQHRTEQVEMIFLLMCHLSYL